MKSLKFCDFRVWATPWIHSEPTPARDDRWRFLADALGSQYADGRRPLCSWRGGLSHFLARLQWWPWPWNVPSEISPRIGSSRLRPPRFIPPVPQRWFWNECENDSISPLALPLLDLHCLCLGLGPNRPRLYGLVILRPLRSRRQVSHMQYFFPKSLLTLLVFLKGWRLRGRHILCPHDTAQATPDREHGWPLYVCKITSWATARHLEVSSSMSPFFLIW